MTEVRDVYLITETTKPDPAKPFNNVPTLTAKLFGLCRVNNIGPQQQQAIFANKVYSDAKTVIVRGHPKANKLAFYGEYDSAAQTGTIYDVTLRRTHANSTAFYAVNTKAGLVSG